ncbi:MAG: hypothetical protein KKH61_20635 [Gammaproteobacteria bacterium]|nr:hypothetical protein [Gammaproteobacteria bacterium]
MATENQIDMIRRICRTHLINLNDVVGVAGPLEGMSADQAKKTICALADGDFGGLTMRRSPDGRCTARQITTLYKLAYEALDPPLMPTTWAFIQRYYPEAENVTSLNCRQATRIIVELDRLVGETWAPEWVAEGVA